MGSGGTVTPRKRGGTGTGDRTGTDKTGTGGTRSETQGRGNRGGVPPGGQWG